METIEIEILASKIAEKVSAQPRWLSTAQATKYARIGKNKVKRLAQEGKIRGYPDEESGRGDWIFDRLSLDKYRMAPLEMSNAKKKQILAKFKGLL